MRSAYLFPGQGSQQVGMGQDAYQRSPAAKAIFDEADALLGFPLTDLIFNGPEEQLTDTANQQPALFVTSLAHWYAMLDLGWPLPEFVAGHSLGEFSALVAAGSISFAAGLALVRRRGELMKAAGENEPGGMAAVLALDVPIVRDLCAAAAASTGFPVQVANDNCPGQIVISGHERALLLAMDLAGQSGARKVVRLPITIAAHSQLMAPAAQAFASVVDAAPIENSQIPVIGNVSALPLQAISEIRQELKAQLVSPVAWSASMRYLLAQGIDTFIEVGPGTVLLGLIKRVDRKSTRIEFDLDHVPTAL